MIGGYMYILKCANGAYYVGSTRNLDLRLQQHQSGLGSVYTKKHLPVTLIYFETFQRIDEAFAREQQLKGWSRKKKEALINEALENLHVLAQCRNSSHYKNKPIE